MQTSNSLALYAWFIATLAGSHSFHLVRALSRSPSLDGAYIIYLRSKKVNILGRVFLHIFLVFRAFHVMIFISLTKYTVQIKNDAFIFHIVPQLYVTSSIIALLSSLKRMPRIRHMWQMRHRLYILQCLHARSRKQFRYPF